MKFARDRTYSDPEKAARKLLEIASDVESHEYKAGLDLAIERGLAGASRERNLRQVHAKRRRSRLTLD